MSVQGLCQICEHARADHQCRRCGMLVCSDDFEEARGVCVECATGGGPQI